MNTSTDNPATLLAGAAGDINSRIGLLDDPQAARPMGETLAALILEAAPRGRSFNPTPLRVYRQNVPLPLGPNAQQNYSARQHDTANNTIETEIQVIRLGNLALISAPGELFSQIGWTLEMASPFDTTFVISCANDNLGYLYTEAAKREGGYESASGLVDTAETHLLPAMRQVLQNAHQHTP